MLIAKKVPSDQQQKLSFAPMGKKPKSNLKVALPAKDGKNTNPQPEKVKSYDGSAPKLQPTTISRSIKHHAGKAARDLENHNTKLAKKK